jgi:eukaryotic-like serine/threonine-protein kinase
MVRELQAGDPRSVGPFRLLGRLGAGGMGQVFLGRSATGRLVAVKVIRRELAGDPDFQARFGREVTAARKVGGLFTAQVVDADVNGPVPWLATAYVAGPSLATAVETQGPLPVASVLTLAAGLAEGLAAIHAAGVVHRDLKPSNVLLADDGPRVIDFGISQAAEASVLTQAGTVMGSPGYMSPEQAGGRAVGPPSDVFSLGTVLAYAATGRNPFGTGPTPALIYRVIHSEPDIAGLPGQLRSLVGRCLAKDPRQRPTPGDLLTELGPGQLASDWLPAPLTEVLTGYTPPDPAAEQATETSPPARQTIPPEQSGGPADPPGTRRNVRRLAWVAALAVLIAGSVSAAVALSSGSTPEPPLPPPASPTVTAGSTAPPSSATTGPVTGSVPNVTDMTLSAAASTLKARGFGNIPYLYDCYRSPDILDVVRQVPGPGAQIALSAPVRLYLQAKNCSTVPNVIGMNLSNAAYTLKQEGFSNIPYLYQCYGSPDIGAVVRQSPAPGTSYGENQPVSLKLQANNC